MVVNQLIVYSLLMNCAVVLSAKLGSYRLDRGQVSVSGISSGACMATQFHVAHSKGVMGAGMIAGAPYLCAGGNVFTSTTCMQTPTFINIPALHSITASLALDHSIDAISYMSNDKVWIFAGASDSVVRPGAGQKVAEYYGDYISPDSLRTVFNVAAEHSMPTDNYGGSCGVLNMATYINNCAYNAAFEMLNFIYGGNLSAPVAANDDSLTLYDQREFFYFFPPATYSMDNLGYVYVPTACHNQHTVCKLHIAFHGCKMGRSRIGDVYVRHAGYNEVAEANNIIVLYPQVISTFVNLQGCWDWWGYTGPLYATKSGSQMTAVHRMLERLIG